MQAGHIPYKCKYSDVGCPALLPPAAMTIHLEKEANTHLKLLARALTVEQSDNDFHREAMTCAQSRCRRIELENASYRRRIDEIKSRIEAMELTPDQKDLFLLIMERDPEALKENKQHFEKKHDSEEGAMFEEEKLLRKVLRDKLNTLKDENEKANTQLLQLTEKLKKKRDEENYGKEGKSQPPLYIMGIPINPTPGKFGAAKRQGMSRNDGLFNSFRKLFTFKSPSSTPGSSVTKENFDTIMKKWEDKNEKIQALKKIIKKMGDAE